MFVINEFIINIESNDKIFAGDNGEKIDLSNNKEWQDLSTPTDTINMEKIYFHKI